MKRFIRYTLLFLLGIYLLACAILYFYQEKLLFHPTHLPENYTFQMGEEIEIPITQELSMNALWVKSIERKGVILFLHGNRGSAARALYQTRLLQGHGYDIFIPDYRSFGKTEGAYSSDKEMFGDMDKVMDFLHKNYAPEQIVLFGYSLGSGPSTYLASHYDVQQVFLVAPFTSIVDMKNKYFPFIPNFLVKYPLQNKHHLQNTVEPVMIFHGTEDEVIPYDHGLTLSSLAGHIELTTLQGVNHRSAIFSRKIAEELHRRLQ